MGHGELICRDCFAETGMENVTQRSGAGDGARTEFVCPNCGSDSFAV